MVRPKLPLIPSIAEDQIMRHLKGLVRVLGASDVALLTGRGDYEELVSMLATGDMNYSPILELRIKRSDLRRNSDPRLERLIDDSRTKSKSTSGLSIEHVPVAQWTPTIIASSLTEISACRNRRT